MVTNYSEKEKGVAAISIFEIKMQQTMERIEEEHLQDTCGAEMIFKGMYMK